MLDSKHYTDYNLFDVIDKYTDITYQQSQTMCC
jgi:hypothetical protein